MESRNSYKLDRYKAAFSDYQSAAEAFNNQVLLGAQETRLSAAEFSVLAYELDVKHKHFVECARRCAGQVPFQHLDP